MSSFAACDFATTLNNQSMSPGFLNLDSLLAPSPGIDQTIDHQGGPFGGLMVHQPPLPAPSPSPAPHHLQPQQHYQPQPQHQHHQHQSVEDKLVGLFPPSILRETPGQWRKYKASIGPLTAEEETLVATMRRSGRSCIYAERTRQKNRVRQQETVVQLDQTLIELTAAHAEIAALRRELVQWRGY
jgi:hypothetical protein